MIQENSKKYQLDINSIKRLLQKAVVFYTPILLVLLDQIQKNNIDYRVLYAMWLSLTIDLVRRFLTDYSKE